MRSRQTLGLACVFLSVAAAVPDGAARPPVTVAVLREDGILLPIATFEGKWKNKWPLPAAEVEVPITLADVPKGWWPDGRVPRDWTFWPPDAPARRLTVSAPAWMRAQCVSNVGLRTDFRSAMALPDPEAMPFPKAGLVTSAGADAVRVEPISVLDSKAEEWPQLVKDLEQGFEAAEERIRGATGYEESWIDPTSLPSGPIAIEAVYRAPDIVPGRFLYYFELTRRHRVIWAAGPSCDLVTFVSGWARLGQGRRDMRLKPVVTDCRRAEAVFQHPLGVVRVHGGRPFWVVQWSTWQAEWYSIIDFENPLVPKTLLETWGGGCR